MFSAQVARYTSISVAESYVYAPEFRLGLFLSPQVPGYFSDPQGGISSPQGGFSDPFGSSAPDTGLFRERSHRTDTNVSVTQTLHDRSTLSGYYSLATANYDAEILNYTTQGGGRPLSASVFP